MEASELASPISLVKFMVDANVDEALGSLLEHRGYRVAFVNQEFLPGTPDADIDTVARRDGWIIVSHDRRFMRRIQQARFNFADPVTTGYGRIMLSNEEAQQVVRFNETIDVIEMLITYALHAGKRLVVTIGPNWVRLDDMPLVRHG